MIQTTAPESLRRLINNCQDGIEHELDQLGDRHPDDWVLVLLDGTSPIAGIAPPEVAEGGAASTAAKLLPKAKVVQMMLRYGEMSSKLAENQFCGHVKLFASNRDGAVVECTVCGQNPGERGLA